MIMKMALLGGIDKRSDDKFRRNTDNLVDRWDTVNNDRYLVLVLLHLDHFHFVTTASLRLVGLHSAAGTFVDRRFEKMNRRQPVHAKMKIHDHPAAGGEISNKYYGGDKLLHGQLQR